MKEIEGNSKGVKRTAQEDTGEDREAKRDFFEPPIKRSHKEKRFQSDSQEENEFREWLKNESAGGNSKPLPETDSESDDSDTTIEDPKDKNEDFS